MLLQEIINILYVSHFSQETDAKLAGVGLGNTMIVVFGVGAYVGLNSALNALTAQAIGAGHMELCGVYLWQARIVLVLFYVVCLPIFIYSEDLLNLVHQDPKVAHFASLYLKSVLPGLFFVGHIDIDRNFITSFGQSKITYYC